jgi:hypothetical protein
MLQKMLAETWVDMVFGLENRKKYSQMTVT